MINDEELNQLMENQQKNEIVERTQEIAKPEAQPREVEMLMKKEISDQYQNAKEKVFKNEEFSDLIKRITEREAKVQLEGDMLQILNEEQKNALAKYILDKEKEQLEYRKRKEKRLVQEQVKVDVFNKKVEVLKKKYGYLYERDKDGNLIDFIPNKSYNRYRAFCRWYEGTGNGFKKITKTTLKVLMWVAIAAIIILVGYKLVKWISTFNIPTV